MATEKVIVVGASAGGVDALKKLVAQLPADLCAAIFVTQHLYRRSDTILPEILAQATRLPVKQPSTREPIVPGTIYVAPPDCHLLLARGTVTLGHGPKENLQRPCINVMFRSAAASYGRDVIGVLLTGMLDDGASGLWEIKQRGGIAVVQDPRDAAYASMPESAIRGFRVDYILPLSDIGPLLESLICGGADVNGAGEIPEPVVADSEYDQGCPECGGVMKETRQGLLYKYRCHVGHRFGLKTMIAEKTDMVERMLSAALAQTEELIALLGRAQSSGDPAIDNSVAEEVRRRKQQIEALRELLTSRTPQSLGS